MIDEKSSENGDTNTNNNGNQNPTCVKMPHIPFHKGRKAPPRGNDDLERTLKNVQVEFENLVKRTHLPKPNLTGREYKAVKELRNHPELTIVRSDKGGEFVVMNTTQLHDLTTDPLSDETTYKKLPKNPTEAMRMEINQTLKNILIARGYPRIFYEKFMTPETAKTQRFYTLPKTHKKTLKIRPIVSGKGGIFDRMVPPKSTETSVNQCSCSHQQHATADRQVRLSTNRTADRKNPNFFRCTCTIHQYQH